MRQLVTSDGEEAARFEYDSFGQMTVVPGSAAIDYIFGYTGREHDAESHLQFNRARYYDAALGRWISEDPIGFVAGDENLSRYVGNGPTNATDPSGLDEWEDWARARVAEMEWDAFRDKVAAAKAAEARRQAAIIGRKNCIEGCHPRLSPSTLTPRDDDLGPVSGFFSDTANEGMEKRSFLGALQAMFFGMLVGPAALVDTVPAAITRSASETKQHIEECEEKADTKVEKALHRGMGVLVSIGELFAQWANSVGAMAPILGGAGLSGQPLPGFAPPAAQRPGAAQPPDAPKYPADPDKWTPPKGWKETPAGDKTGGKHRQWADEEGNIRRRWDREGREGGKDRGPHWHDNDDPSGGRNHIDPDG